MTASRYTVRLSRPVVLVGLMGAGKTSVGKRLAAFLDAPFEDSDAAIEEAAGMSISDIFATYGEAHFRAGEERVIARLLEGSAIVLATGGGAFLSPATRETIAKHGISIWLNGDHDTLWSRVKDKSTRPLLQRPDAYEHLGNLLKDRSPLYALADITVASEDGLEHEVMVRRILEAIEAHDRDHPDRAPTLLKGISHEP